MKAAVLLAFALLFAIGFAKEGVFDSKGAKIRYVTAGEGEAAVILIHGWQSDATMWGRDPEGNPKLEATPGFKVIALDCRGHGKSDKPNAYGVEMANDVVRLMDHLKVKKAHLVGYSMGAFIAGNVVVRYPNRVSSVVYGGQAPLLVGDDNRSSEIDAFDRAVQAGKGMGQYLIDVTPPNRFKPTLEMANAFAERMFKGKDLKALAAAGKSFPDLAVRQEDLAKFKGPTLFLRGSLEAETTKARVERLRKGLSNVEVVVIEGADHMTTLVKPQFGTTVVEFLKKAKG